MKKYTFIIAVLLFGNSYAQNEFHVAVNISGVDTGFAFLMYKNDSNEWQKDSLLIDGNELHFKGIVNQLTLAYLRFSNKGLGNLEFVLDKGETRIAGTAASLAKAEVKGSDETNVYEERKQLLNPFDEVEKTLYAKYKESEKTDDKTAMKAIDEEYDSIQDVKQTIIRKFIYAHPKNIVSTNFISGLISYNVHVDTLRNLFASLDEDVRNNKQGKEVEETIMSYAKNAIGEPAQLFTQKDMNGKEIDFQGVNKGKVLLLDFWASWCGPCRRENPNVVAAYEKYHKKGFEILGISLDKDKTKWKAAVEKDKLTWQNLSDLKGWDNEVAKMYAIRSIPSNFLIDANGIIIAKNLRGEDLEKKLEELLK